jgi:phosphoglycolate phosphatase
MIRLVLLDFDGTLCVTHEAISHCLVETMRHYRLPHPSGEAIMRTLRSGIGLAETFAALAGDEGTGDVAAGDLVLKYRELYNGGVADSRSRFFPGARESLERLREQGVKLAVLSNKGEVAVRAALARFELLELVDLVVCETPGIAKKPDPASYIRLVRPAFPDVDGSEILVVGDTIADIQYAANIGASSCWAEYGYGEAAECSRLNPTARIASISELPELLLAWSARDRAA